MSLLADMDAFRLELGRQADLIEAQGKVIAKQEEQINGERGLSAAINTLMDEVRGLRKAMYWVAGLIVMGSIGMAFTAIQLVGTGGTP